MCEDVPISVALCAWNSNNLIFLDPATLQSPEISMIIDHLIQLNGKTTGETNMGSITS
jgi:hypothetical protein